MYKGYVYIGLHFTFYNIDDVMLMINWLSHRSLCIVYVYIDRHILIEKISRHFTYKRRINANEIHEVLYSIYIYRNRKFFVISFYVSALQIHIYFNNINKVISMLVIKYIWTQGDYLEKMEKNLARKLTLNVENWYTVCKMK